MNRSGGVVVRCVDRRRRDSSGGGELAHQSRRRRRRGTFPSDSHLPSALPTDGDAAFGQGAAMPLCEGERFELHHQAQQTANLELFRERIWAAWTAWSSRGS